MRGAKKQILQVAIAVAGMIAVFGYMGQMMYSGAQRYEPSAEGGLVDEHRDRMIQERALELRDALNLTEEQMTMVTEALTRFRFGEDASAWQRQRRAFLFQSRENLTPEQQALLDQWESEQRRERALRARGGNRMRPGSRTTAAETAETTETGGNSGTSPQ